MSPQPSDHAIDYQRLYEYRFRGVEQGTRQRVWTEIARFVFEKLEYPARMLDPAAGRCEFINAVPAAERWAVDETPYAEADAVPGTRVVVSDIMEAELPESYFDAVWVSNFLEHLSSQEHVAAFLKRMRTVLRDGGRIAVMGPNFKFAASEYFDCADHTVALTHISTAEHLYAAGFEVTEVVPRFLPYSFRGRFPASARLTRLYLTTKPAWRLVGKQFLVVGQRSTSP